MDFSNQEEIEIETIEQIINKVTSYDEFLSNAMMAEIRSKQAFVRSLITGFQRDLKPDELEATQTLVFIIWEYFKSFENTEYANITESQFGQAMNRNIAAMQEMDANESEISEATNLPCKSKTLFETIANRVNSLAIFVDMETEIKGIVVVGMKSLIECFEMNAKTKEVKKSKGLFKWWK